MPSVMRLQIVDEVCNFQLFFGGLYQDIKINEENIAVGIWGLNYVCKIPIQPILFLPQKFELWLVPSLSVSQLGATVIGICLLVCVSLHVTGGEMMVYRN